MANGKEKERTTNDRTKDTTKAQEKDLARTMRVAKDTDMERKEDTKEKEKEKESTTKEKEKAAEKDTTKEKEQAKANSEKVTTTDLSLWKLAL